VSTSSHRKSASNEAAPKENRPVQSAAAYSAGSGAALDTASRRFFEPRFGFNFDQVRVHTDPKAAESARAINARAYTVGRDIAFGAGMYAPGTESGRRLLAHELTHVVQQSNSGKQPSRLTHCAPTPAPMVQRKLGDGHDLTSPRFSRLMDLEAAYDDEKYVKKGSKGRGVQAIQQALYDLGFSLPKYGADGKFGKETKAAVEAFQRANPPLADDGIVGPKTMTALDKRFGAVTLPAAAARAAPWTPSCVRSILCPWSPHTVDVLRTRITLKSFKSISWADEKWNGTNWVAAPFIGGGYNTGTEIGVLNTNCEKMSEILYHEVLHAEQPSTHKTTREKESYAYRIGEEFSIAMGLGGRSSLRSTDVQGRQFADPTKVGAFVAKKYPSVPKGKSRDEIIGKAATHGHVRVQRPDGSIYTRPAKKDEKVPGPITTVPPGGVTHSTATWTCP
jgi:hypothetical protein